jgi:hypothetical protein
MTDKNYRDTRFVDIDGTILYHNHTLSHIVTGKPSLLPGVSEKFEQWRKQGDYIVLTTARSEGLRSLTEQHLYSVGLYWDQLVMGLPVGPRTVYNDRSHGRDRAFAVNLDRNEGLQNVT